MPLLDTIRSQKLVELGTTRFDANLWDGEVTVLNSSASSEDLPKPLPGAPMPLIRPEFVRWLATDPETVPFIDPKGIGVYGFEIQGDLDLRECRIRVPLYFIGCAIHGKIKLLFAETLTVFLRDCPAVGGIEGDGVEVAGPLSLRQSTFTGRVSLKNARIGGDLDCRGTHFQLAQPNPAVIDPDSPGKINKLEALWVDGGEVMGDVLLSEGFTSNGTIRLLGAHIKSDLKCAGAKILVERVNNGLANPALAGNQPANNVADLPNAIFADGVRIDGDVTLTEGFESLGEIRFLGAQIKGQLNCAGAQLEVRAPGAPAPTEELDVLSADGANMEGGVFLDSGFRCAGTIRLLGARIGGQLRFKQARVRGVNCTNLQLARDLIWKEIENPEETELILTGAKVKNLRDDRVSWPASNKLKLNGFLYEELTLDNEPPRARRNLLEWYRRRRLRPRNAWLARQPCIPRVEPQPWMQLSSYFEQKGDHVGAKHVVFEFRRLRVAQNRFFARRSAIAFAWLEESPVRILWSIAATLLLGTLIFTGANRSGAMIPNAKDATDPNAVTVPAHYPPFQAFVYTLENALPLVKLGMDDKWTPDPKHVPRRFVREIYGLGWLRYLNGYWFLAISRWLLILSGWFQASVLAAALSGRFKQ